MKKLATKTIVTLGMLSAVAFLAAWIIKIPVFGFLDLEPKDTILAITGFLFGPAAAIICTLCVSVAETLLVSSTGWIGLVMNLLSSSAFALTAALFYERSRTLRGAIKGLIFGTLLMVAVMLLWNYLLTPLYMNMPRSEVAQYMLPVFLPFNLVKGSMNTALTLLLYKPLVRSLKLAHLLPETHTARGERRAKPYTVIIIVCLLVLAVCAYLLFKWHSQ